MKMNLKKLYPVLILLLLGIAQGFVLAQIASHVAISEKKAVAIEAGGTLVPPPSYIHFSP